MRRGVSGFDSVSASGRRVCRGRHRLRLLVLLLGLNQAVSKEESQPRQKSGRARRGLTGSGCAASPTKTSGPDSCTQSSRSGTSLKATHVGD